MYIVYFDMQNYEKKFANHFFFSFFCNFLIFFFPPYNKNALHLFAKVQGNMDGMTTTAF